MYIETQVVGRFANKANASDVYTKSQVDGLIPSLLYGEFKFYDDDTGTRRGVISHPTTLRLALTQSINPTGSPIIMTICHVSGVVVPAALRVWRRYLRTQHI